MSLQAVRSSCFVDRFAVLDFFRGAARRAGEAFAPSRNVLQFRGVARLEADQRPF